MRQSIRTQVGTWGHVDAEDPRLVAPVAPPSRADGDDEDPERGGMSGATVTSLPITFQLPGGQVPFPGSPALLDAHLRLHPLGPPSRVCVSPGHGGGMLPFGLA